MRDKSSKRKVIKSHRKTNGANLHVVPRVDGWAVRAEGSTRATSLHNSQREAVEAARKLAKEAATQLVIHGRDGRIRERDSYGSDPLPPKQPRKVLYPDTKTLTDRRSIRRAVNEALSELK